MDSNHRPSVRKTVLRRPPDYAGIETPLPGRSAWAPETGKQALPDARRSDRSPRPSPRGKGQQRITVEHGHVHASAQRGEMLPLFLEEIETYLALEPALRAKPTPLFFIFHLLGACRERDAL